MQNTNALVLSWTKRTATSGWTVRVELPSGILLDLPVREQGAVPLGAVLSALLPELDRIPEEYPFQYNMTDIPNREFRTIHIRFLAERPVYAEVSHRVSDFLKEAMHQSNWVSAIEKLPEAPADIRFLQLQSESRPNLMMRNSTKETVEAEVRNEYADKENRFWVFLDPATIETIDGDTIDGYIMGYAWPEGVNIPSYIGGQKMKEYDRKVRVRYLGVDTFETFKKNDSYTYNRNNTKSNYYGVDKTVLDAAADEAHRMNKALVTSGGILAVSLQYDIVKDAPVPDYYGRLLGIVYATEYQSYEQVRRALQEGVFQGINVNKELLKPMYSRYQHVLANTPASVAVPLAEFTGNRYADKAEGLNISNWAAELNLSIPPDADTLKKTNNLQQHQAETEQIEEAVKRKASTYQFKGDIRQDTKLKGYINNDLAFVPAKDDRIEDALIYGPSAAQEEDYPFDYTHRVRIGDVFLSIPPLAIRMDKQYQTEDVQTMRAKSSLQKQIGTTRNILSLDLYFASSEDVNGEETVGYYTKEGRPVPYYMDGLRPLLAQFKKAPFLPIDNEYINESLGVHNVALRNVQVETVAGFPEALKATLILEEFDAAPYLMGKAQLGDLINYPLLRWHYQRLLHKPDIYEPWRSYLPPVENLDNRVTFSILNEEQLINRKEAIVAFRNKQTPSEFKRELVDLDKESGRKRHDAELVATAMKEYEAFMDEHTNQTILKKHGLENHYKHARDVPVVIGESFGWDTALNLLNHYTPAETKAGQEIAIALYREGEPGISEKRVSAYAGPVAQIFGTPADAFFPFRALSSGTHVSPLLPNVVTQAIVEHDLPGYFQLYLTNEQHKKDFAEWKATFFSSLTGVRYKDSMKPDNGELFVIPAGNLPGKGRNYLDKLKGLVKVDKQTEYRLKSYEEEYNALATEINRTEENMAMDEYLIPDMIPLGLTVSLENTFSTVQVQAAQTPTMQFFGAADPEIQLTFETTDEGVAALEFMMRRVGQYVREYREGIVSGFMGIENPLIALFGIRTVLPRNVQYNTIQGHPDRKLVTLTCSAFDKSQRRQEALYGYTGGDTDETLRDRAYDNYDPGKDSMYVHERMRQMELYPDLEMPKISELNTVLPAINAGLDKWENRTDQVFLDPDFYVSTEHTYRKFLKDVLDSEEDIVFRWADAQGYVADSSLREENPLKFHPSGRSQAEFEAEAKEAPYADPTLNWRDFGDESAEATAPTETPVQEVAQLSEPETVFQSEAVKRTARGGNEPSFHLWQQWPGNGGKSRSDFTAWQKELQAGIDPAELWFHLAKVVMDSFVGSNLEYAGSDMGKQERDLIRDGDFNQTMKALESYYRKGERLGDLTWMDEEKYFQKIVNGIIWAKENLENGKEIDESNIGFFEKGLNALANENPYPFQRILSYLRALMKVESGGRQTNGLSPLLYDLNAEGVPTKAGIMGAKLTDAADEVTANRLIWDWRYNIEQVVGEMAKVFRQAETSNFQEIFAQRMDWAIASRSWSALPAILASNDHKDDVPKGYLNGPINPQRNALHQKVMLTRNSESAQTRGSVAPGLYLDLEGRIIPEVFAYYTNRKKLLTKGEKGSDKLADAIAEVEVTIHRNIPIGSQEERLKGMFVDLYQYDHTGRLLRAFPSFSLQLIDEGKWYSNFRTWDNFYGYNALQSIDVYKSRKIAADTAIVQMSNMYGGLSSKRKDMEYPDLQQPSFFSNQFWENYVLGVPTEEILEARKEIFKSMMLEPGARLHLRMGYGADARHLPPVFNGTITEVGLGDVVTITAQGDALELTNTIAGNPDDENRKGFMNNVIEPYELIGELMTSKGNWLKDMISDLSDGKYFRDSPLGIAHFGSPIAAPKGVWSPFSGEYGEVMENVYSQNGLGEKSQWMKRNGTTVNAIVQQVSSFFGTDIMNLAGENDEDNIALKLYGNTPWDIFQTLALCTHDYTTAVFPFEFRSSLFFGKPHWPVVYDYDTEYEHDAESNRWRKHIVQTHRKTFMQAHLATSEYNLVSNDMRASSEGVYNNVVVEYDGHVTPPIQADNDIRFDQQRTAHIQANIIARKKGGIANLLNYHTTEAQAQRYGHSTVRDFMKDMYKGSYTVLGDATIKPHDTIYLSDTVQDIQGIHLVKAVHHAMSLEHGFISTVEPDAYVLNFDAEGLFMVDKVFSTLKAMNARTFFGGVARVGGFYVGASITNKLLLNMKAFWATNGTDILKYSDEVMAKFSTNILRKSTGMQLKMVGQFLNDPSLVQQGQFFRKHAGPVPDAVMKDMRRRVSDLSSQWTLRRSRQLRDQKKAVRFSQNVNGLQRAFSANKIEAAVETLLRTDDLLFNYSEALAARKAVNRAKLITTTIKAADVAGDAIKVTGKVIYKVFSKAFVWGIIFDVALEVITSTLIEKWSRRKQDAECVKVFPLQQKGKAWLAGMNGHRGSVWGDSPSLKDRWWQARFFDEDNENDTFLYLLPKLINFVAGEDESASLYEASRAASEYE